MIHWIDLPLDLLRRCEILTATTAANAPAGTVTLVLTVPADEIVVVLAADLFATAGPSTAGHALSMQASAANPAVPIALGHTDQGALTAIARPLYRWSWIPPFIVPSGYLVNFVNEGALGVGTTVTYRLWFVRLKWQKEGHPSRDFAV